jgi:hypothetical protein
LLSDQWQAAPKADRLSEGRPFADCRNPIDGSNRDERRYRDGSKVSRLHPSRPYQDAAATIGPAGRPVHGHHADARILLPEGPPADAGTGALPPQLTVGYTQVVTITTDDWHTTNNYRQQTSAPWPFLYDEERIVQKDLDIKEYTDTSHDVMIPHTIVLGRGLEVAKVYNGYYYWGRPSVAELHAELRELARRTYSDWDITRPELRKKWQEGDKSDFYPYGKNSISMETLMLQMAGAWISMPAGRKDTEARGRFLPDAA